MKATDKLIVELFTKYYSARAREHLKQSVRNQYKTGKNGQ